VNRAELLARLRAEPEWDAAVACIGEPDYGCEACAEDAPEKVWLALLLRDGTEKSLELPALRADALGLTEGALCRLSDLRG
jgi:hypothetical protein